MHTQDGALRWVDDRRGHQGTEHTTVSDGEVTARQIFNRQLAVATFNCQFFNVLLDVCHTQQIHITQDRRDQGRELAFKLGLEGKQVQQFTKIFMGLATIFLERDLALIEINPLVVTKQGDLICLDGKLGADGNALFRQADLREMRDQSQEDPREAQAAQWELNYVALDGNIGCMVNGAGLAMGTMDIVKLHGGEPANFLDVGGGATKERVTEAFKIILSDDNVKAVLVNIFGGIVRCDLIADGIIGAVAEVGVNVPVVVRLEGNNAELGAKKLADSGLNIIAAKSLTDAAQQVVAAVEGK